MEPTTRGRPKAAVRKCATCGERPIAFGLTCRKCYDRERYNRIASSGLCVRCRKYRTRQKHVLCPACLTSQRNETTALRADRHHRGLCECGRKRVRGLKSCQACRARKAEGLRRRRAETRRGLLGAITRPAGG